MKQATSLRRQQGVALMTAILAVALATVIASEMVWDQYLQVRRTESMLAQEQARQYALAAESLAMDVMLQDRQDADSIDHLNEPWAVAPEDAVPFELDEGSLIGYIEDLQGRFNINNLYRNGQVDRVSRDQFTRLLENLALEPQLADAVIDWIDPDQDVCCASGAEDDVYTARNPPHRAANRYLTSASELMAVEGLDAETYDALEPFITALPPGWCGAADITPININTAKDQVLLALDANVTTGNVDQWMAERDEIDGYVDLSALQSVVDPQVLEGNYLTVRSECFGATAIISIGSFRYSMYSLLDREGAVGSIVPRVRFFGVY